MMSNFSNKVFLLPVVAVTTLIVGLFLFAKFGPGLPLSIVTTTKTEMFTVTGEGKATAVPDLAEINLGFTATGNTVTDVQGEANQTINKISAAIKNLGVGDKDIRTTNYNLRPNYNFQTGSQKITGFVADVNLLVRVRNFDKINQVIDAGTGNGANQVGGLVLTLDDATREKYESQARKEAIDNAKKKAAEIAAESGLTLGRLINVTENQNLPRPVPLMAQAQPGGGAPSTVPTQIELGSSEITVTVTLSYETR